MNGFIYKITNDINDKVYIGKTLSSIEKRFAEHKKDSQKNVQEKRPLYNAMKKYGVEHFHIEEIGAYPIEELSQQEQYWIQYFQSYTTGYNATRGGDGKPLYDYNAIVNGFLSGKMICELAEEFECCSDTISAALHLAQLDSKMNANKNTKKGVIAKDLNGNFIQAFESRNQAAKWIQENHYTTSTDIDNINATIGRAANKKRNSAYGFIWDNQTNP